MKTMVAWVKHCLPRHATAFGIFLAVISLISGCDDSPSPPPNKSPPVTEAGQGGPGAEDLSTNKK
jgi:hypothetical protein